MRRVRGIEDNNVILGIIALAGSRRLTQQSFRIMRITLNWAATCTNPDASPDVMSTTPSYSTFMRTFLPYLYRNVLLPVHDTVVNVDVTKPGARPSPLLAHQSREEHGQKQILRTILISAWAKRDLSFGAVCWSAQPETDVRSIFTSFIHIDNSNIIKDRSYWLSGGMGLPCEVTKDSSQYCRRLSAGTQVQFEVSCSGPCLLNMNTCTNGTDCDRTHSCTGIVLQTEMIAEGSGNQRPGDLRTNVKLTTPLENESVTIIHRLLREIGEPAVLLEFTSDLRRRPSHRTKCNNLLVRNGLCRHRGNDMACSQHEVQHTTGTSSGILQDGRKYVVYRVLLYADNFQPFTDGKSKFGGCYMVPLNMDITRRVSRDAVRVLGVTPPGVSTNEVIRSMLDDIEEGATKGFPAVDIKGEQVVIFIDIVAFVADYVAVAHSTDCMGPTALAPCHLCCFRRSSREQKERSSYAYTGNINSAHGSFLRTGDRMQAIRANLKSPSQFQRYGIRSNALRQSSPSPLHDIAERLTKARQMVPRNVHGKRVIDASFDPYRSVVIGPDHLLSGVAVDALNAVLRILAPNQRIALESLIRHGHISNLLNTEKRLFNMHTITLHSMSMSSVFSVLLFTPWALETALKLCDHRSRTSYPTQLQSDVCKLVQCLHCLVVKTYYLPCPEVDGLHVCQAWMESTARCVQEELRCMATEYVRLVDKLSRKSNVIRKIIDKPNVHRVLELYFHSVPIMGHVTHFQELLSEAAQQPLKRSIVKYKDAMAHMRAVDVCRADEWKRRVGSSFHNLRGNPSPSHSQMLTLHHILAGSEPGTQVSEETTKRLKTILRQPTAALLTELLDYTRPDPIRVEWSKREEIQHNTSCFPQAVSFLSDMLSVPPEN